MIIDDGGFILSPSDLTISSNCEFGFLRRADILLGRLEPVHADEDAMLARTARLGDAHEERLLEEFKQSGLDVIEIEVASPYSAATLAEAVEATKDAFDAAADVVFQATFFDGQFGGKSDFVVRQPDGTYEVQDAKLARRAKRDALLQIAAYSDQLDQLGVPRTPTAALILGSGEVVHQQIDDVIEVYRHRRRRLEGLLAAHAAQPDSVAWGDDAYTFCGTCEHCVAEIEATNDLMLVAGIRQDQRAKLRAVGITTVTALGSLAEAAQVDDLKSATLAKLRQQARLQASQEVGVDGRPIVTHEVCETAALATLPKPSVGDIFFDFEGDPMWSDNHGRDVGLEYLFGVVELDGSPRGNFTPFWAHTRAEERQALKDFFAHVQKQREKYPDLHIYHYASYEVTALKRLVGQHGHGENILDELLRAGVFVDLYSVVKHAIRVSQPSYSIKKLEPLYMGNHLRDDAGVTTAADSIVKYAEFVDARDRGDAVSADELLGQIADYNHYDCTSTWKLRDWLLALPEAVEARSEAAETAGIDADTTPVVDEAAAQLAASLLEHVPDDDRSPEQQAMALTAAAVSYHQRERKPYWWVYFDRLSSPVEDWVETRNVLIVESAELMRDWSVEGRDRVPSRDIVLRGRFEVGTQLRAGTQVAGIYEDVPPGWELAPRAIRAAGHSGGEIREVDVDEETGLDVVVVKERPLKDQPPHTQLPMAVFDSTYISQDSLIAAVRGFAERIASTAPAWPFGPVEDVMARRSPRLTTDRFNGSLAPDSDCITQIADAIRALNHSYVAIQGPPGTGKTYTGSHVVARLVRKGWKVGVVAQSHETVETFLRAAHSAGLNETQMAKCNGRGDTEPKLWRVPKGNPALRDVITASTGLLVGGTAWTFSNTSILDDEELDLLVIDEAGQFSLGTTIAVGRSAKNLMLIGDPQQLPQVSQGTHPEPIDWSALGWLMDGHGTIPPELGYFLERSYRMHPSVTAPVSRLSYDGRLESQRNVTDARELSGIEPGLNSVPVEHAGNSVVSPEEAAEVVAIVQRSRGLPWRDSASSATRPLDASDVLVVAPYNAQVSTIRRALEQAGLKGVRVGTVDKFQGKEAPIVIVSMTASSSADVPRGVDFLLSRNRLNVAISRAQWAVYLVHSPALRDFLPSSTTGLRELGAFLRLTSGIS